MDAVGRGIELNQPGPLERAGSAAHLVHCASMKFQSGKGRMGREALADSGATWPSHLRHQKCAGVECCPTSQLTVITGEPLVVLVSVFACGSEVEGSHGPGRNS
jgi:hypothetical protein